MKYAVAAHNASPIGAGTHPIRREARPTAIVIAAAAAYQRRATRLGATRSPVRWEVIKDQLPFRGPVRIAAGFHIEKTRPGLSGSAAVCLYDRRPTGPSCFGSQRR